MIVPPRGDWLRKHTPVGCFGEAHNLGGRLTTLAEIDAFEQIATEAQVKLDRSALRPVEGV
jgi:hypothetical protein